MIIGHQKQLQLLIRSAKEGRASHAYIFAGPSKVGKKNAALELVSYLFKTPVCESLAHPDFIYLKADEETNNIKIEQVRDLIWKLSLKPAIAPLKAAIIDGAHSMTADSQNCLLKTLEEPGGQTMIILVANNPRLLLPTVVSRCQTVKFGFVSSKEIGDYLTKEYKAVDIDEIARLASGRPGRAVDFATDKKELERWQNEIKELSSAVSGGLGERFKYVKNICEEKSLEEILEIFTFYFRNLLLDALERDKAKKEPGSPDSGQRAVFQFAKTATAGCSVEKAAAILKELQYLNYALTETNVNARLALENLMLKI